MDTDDTSLYQRSRRAAWQHSSNRCFVNTEILDRPAGHEGLDLEGVWCGMRDINRLLWVFLALGHVARILGRKRIYLDGLPPFTKPANELASAGLDVLRKLACRGCTYIILQHCTVSQRSFPADVQHRNPPICKRTLIGRWLR